MRYLQALRREDREVCFCGPRLSRDAPRRSNNTQTMYEGMSAAEIERECVRCAMRQGFSSDTAKALTVTAGALEQAYAKCGDVTAAYAKTFYLGTQLMTTEQQKVRATRRGERERAR